MLKATGFGSSRGVVSPLLLVVLGALPFSAASAAVFNLVPAGDGIVVGTLRHAIQQANLSPEDDTINLATGDYPLTLANGAGQENLGATGDLDVLQGTVTIFGAGAASTSITAGPALLDRVFHVGAGASLLLRDVTVQGGHAIDDGVVGSLGENGAFGGGILCDACVNLALENALLQLNVAAGNPGAPPVPNGGGPGGDGLAATGGGIAARSPVLVRISGASVVQENEALGGSGADGAAAGAGPGGAGGNGADAEGGGLYVSAGELRVEDATTIRINEATGGDGGYGGAGGAGAFGGVGGGAGGATGGGIYCGGIGLVTLAGDGAVTANVASGGAGAIAGAGGGDGGAGGAAAAGGLMANFQVTLEVSGFRFQGNIAEGGDGGNASASAAAPGTGGLGGIAKAGGIFLFNGSTGTLTLAVFNGHQAIAGGGGVGGDGVPGGPGGSGGTALGGSIVADADSELTVVTTTISDSLAEAGDGAPGGTSTTVGGPGSTGGNGLGGAIAVTGGSTVSIRDSTIATSAARSGDGGSGGPAGVVGPGGAGGPAGVARGGGLYAQGIQTAGPEVINATLSANTASGGDGGDGGAPIGSGGSGGEGTGGNLYTDLALALSNSTVALGVAVAGSGGTPAQGGLAGITPVPEGGNVSIEVAVDGTATSSVLSGGIGGTTPDLAGTLVGCATLVMALGSGVLSPAVGPECANLTGVDPQLLPLASNGGPTATHALALTSPARDVGTDPLALPSDQRQPPYPRVSGLRADMGAYELAAAALATVTVAVAPALIPEAGPGALIYTFTRTDSQTAPLALPLTVCFTVGGSATIAVDYSGVTTGGTCGAMGIVTFAAGSSTATVTATPVPDGVPEGNETVILTVVAGTGYAAGAPGAATGTIFEVAGIPTLEVWGLVALALLLGGAATLRLKRAQRPRSPG